MFSAFIQVDGSGVVSSALIVVQKEKWEVESAKRKLRERKASFFRLFFLMIVLLLLFFFLLFPQTEIPRS